MGAALHRGSKLASRPAPPGSILSIPKNFLLMFIDSTAFNSGRRLNNVNRTHIVLTSGKLVLLKRLRHIYLVADLAGLSGHVDLPVMGPVDLLVPADLAALGTRHRLDIVDTRDVGLERSDLVEGL